MKELVQVGKNTMGWESPDILIGVWVGVMTPEDMTAGFDKLKAFSKDWKRAFALVDVSKLESIPLATRRVANDNTKDVPFASTAVYGASFGVRTVFSLLVRAMSLVTMKPMTLAFFATEAEARVWIDSERKRLDALEAKK